MGRAILITLLMLGGAALVAQDINDSTHVDLGTALSIFGLAFGAWAVVLGWVMVVVRREFQELREFVREEAVRKHEADERAHQDRINIERRIVEVEAAFKFNRRHESQLER